MSLPKEVFTLAEFVAHALAIEDEAAERYETLAAAMQGHANSEAAALFGRMVGIEREHGDRLRERLPGPPRPLDPWEYRWQDFESPESAALEDVHYRMTPHHALEVALAGEVRARDFYQHVAASDSGEDVRGLAAELAGEEDGHVRIVRALLEGTPPPPPDWQDDHDPPVAVD